MFQPLLQIYKMIEFGKKEKSENFAKNFVSKEDL